MDDAVDEGPGFFRASTPAPPFPRFQPSPPSPTDLSRPTIMVKCSICHYISPPDGPGHDARTCPLNSVQCRRDLPKGHAFYQAGQCVKPVCIHQAHCNSCGFTGHQYGTQKLSVTRFKLNNKGIIVRRQNKHPLGVEDFVCTLMTPLSIKSMVNNTQSTSAAKAIDAHERRVSTTRLMANVNSENVDLKETILLLENKGTKSALLSDVNKPNFLNLSKNAHLGAITASRVAAEAAESSLDGSSGSDSDNGEEEVGTGDEKPACKKTDRAVRGHEKARKSRIDRYALAIARSRAKSKAGRAGHGKPRSSPSKKGGGMSTAAATTAGDDVIDVEGDTTMKEGDWPIGSRSVFGVPLPSFFSPSFAATPPVKLAHIVLEHMCQCPIGDVDKDLGGCVVKGAVESHVRGYMLASGTLSAAQVAEWMCATMDGAMRAATLSTVARAVADVVENAATEAATAAGLKTPAQRRLGGEAL